MKRRAFLATASALGAGLAGCLEAGDEPDGGTGDGDDQQGNGDDDGSQSGEDGIAGTTITTTGSDCGGPDDDRVAADVDGSTVTLVGTLGAPNPCHEAVITAAEVTDGHLSVTVDVESDLPDDEECVTCQGAVSYEATVDLGDGATIVGGTVEHATGDSHEFDGDADADSSPAVRRTDITTTDVGCFGVGDTAGVDIVREDGVVVLEGGFTASNPCNRAVLEGATIEDDTLHVTVGVESTLDEGEVCQQCQGFVSYEAGIEVDSLDALEAVRVEHPDGSTYSE